MTLPVGIGHMDPQRKPMKTERVLLPKEVANEEERAVLGGDGGPVPDVLVDPTLDPPAFFHPLTLPRPVRERLAYAWALERGSER